MRSEVKIIKGLKDWSPDAAGLIPKGVSAARKMDGAVPEEMGLYTDEKGNYHTSGTVGVGWLRDEHGKIIIDPVTNQKCALIIIPRYALNPWDMLIKVMNDPEYELYVSGLNGDFFKIYTDQELIPVNSTEKGGELLAAISLVKECERMCKKYLHRSIDFKEENFNGKVVGNIQVSKHIKSNITQGREDRIFCRYPVFTVDTLENRIMKAALKKAHTVIRRSGLPLKSLGRIYSFCENSLKDVRTVKISRSDFGKVNVTGFNSVYKKIIELAKTILTENISNDLFAKETEEIKYIIPYTINMESLFEFYVRATIREYLKSQVESNVILDEYRIPKKNPLFTLKDPEHHAYLMNNYVPDIALIDNSGEKKRYIAVFDVKYQNSTSKVYKDTQRHNSHQLLFYMLLLNVRRCGFIFPSDKKNADLPGLNMFELNIQSGDAMDSSVREYTQWMVDMNQDHHEKFAERIMAYVRGMQNNSGFVSED
ncbi:McrBC 5-methylcytosine restriction system component [Lachnospiraceae bacterium KH1T2]|nr:McrBC 5-methylcytosine restriction system component [Lachnospiraceae bacterium KH1T2]